MTELESASKERTQRIWARLAGGLFLWLIINGLVGTLIVSRVAGSGSFAETAKRIAASERLYRVGLVSAVIEILSGALLFFALYVTLKPVSNTLAQLALIFSLLDSALGCLVRICDFVRLNLSTSAATSGAGMLSAQALTDLVRNISRATENIGGILFGIGAVLFFYLFFKSGYIPRGLSSLGLAASVIWTVLYLVGLVFPELRSAFLYICFPAMAIANAATGFWLAVFAIRPR